MLGKFLIFTIIIFVASESMAQSVALDMPEEEYRGLVNMVAGNFGQTNMDQLDAGQIGWLKLACGVIDEREAYNSNEAENAGESYISSTTLGVCDRVSSLSPEN